MAVAASGCGCSVDAVGSAAVFAKVVVTAHASAYSKVCTSGNAAGQASSYQEAFVAASLEAFAQAIAKAAAGGGSCAASIEANTGITPGGGSGTTSQTDADCIAATGAKCGAMANGSASGTTTVMQVAPPLAAATPTPAVQPGAGTGSCASPAERWYYVDRCLPLCADQAACCRLGANGWTGAWFQTKCKGCNFPARSKFWHC